MKCCIVYLIVIFFSLVSNNGHAATLAGCQILPQDNIWNARVDTLPVAANSDAMINTIGANTGLHPDFGSGTWNNVKIGIPINIVG